MRIRRLDLVRYGKFTDYQIDLPRPQNTDQPDFHLIVGPNEAGKSTIRHAISDLLFGIENRSRFDFLHDKKEMRIGAELETPETKIEFYRLKRNKHPLYDPQNNVLPDDALAPFTGNADRTSFEREFCLDHTRLAAGGQSILNAKDDVGRMLFEASSGVGVFGEVLDQLENEAANLWTRNRSKDREYYKAFDAFNAAKKAVKEATASTREWKNINNQIAEATQALDDANNHFRKLDQTRTRLERIRRLAPHFRTRNENIEKLNQLDTTGNDPVLARKDDIIDLHDEKIRIKNHPLDIAKREAESNALSHDIKVLAADLEWQITDEESLESALPSALLRKSIETLANRYGGLEQALRGATENLKTKKAEIDQWTAELQALPDADLPQQVIDALAQARDLGNIENAKIEITNHLAKINDQLTVQMARMQPWSGSVRELRQLAVPGNEEVQAFKNREHDIVSQQKNLAAQYEETLSELRSCQLEVSQLQGEDQLITADEIIKSRKSRNELWSKIRKKEQTTNDSGDEFENRMATADKLSDRRFQNAQAAKDLEHLQYTITSLQQKQNRHADKIEQLKQQHTKLITEWGQVTQRLNLDGMTISAFQTLLGHYRSALQQAEVLTDQQANLTRLGEQEAAAITNLQQALNHKPATKHTLKQLITEAEATVSGIKTTKDRCDLLKHQLQRGQNALATLKDISLSARQQMENWNTEWSQKISAARLPDNITPETVGTALSIINDLKDKLNQNRELKQNRIKTMQRDMENYHIKAKTLAKALIPDFAGVSPREICAALDEQLEKAEQTQKIIQDTKDAIDKATQTIVENSDGLSLDDLQAEIACEDLTTIANRISEIRQQSDTAISNRDECLSQLKDAETERAKIHGQADAATAEASRQDALAKMAQVTERFIKVHIGSKLLRWSIERYREEKRGPLLERASQIFATLTTGSFTSLAIDYDGDEPQLMGRRPDGKHVDFDGLSEGTGDQLYLSLRLAAVELQLQHTQALPFIADDLFINYSDNRTAQGFKVLGQLASKSQVIYFTHHDHLADIARDTLGENLSITLL